MSLIADQRFRRTHVAKFDGQLWLSENQHFPCLKAIKLVFLAGFWHCHFYFLFLDFWHCLRITFQCFTIHFSAKDERSVSEMRIRFIMLIKSGFKIVYIHISRSFFLCSLPNFTMEIRQCFIFKIMYYGIPQKSLHCIHIIYYNTSIYGFNYIFCILSVNMHAR